MLCTAFLSIALMLVDGLLPIVSAFAVCGQESVDNNEVKESEMKALQGIWANCPSESEEGPVFTELRISEKGDWELFLYGRSNEDDVWTGSLIMAGKIDVSERQLLPTAEYAKKHGVETGGYEWRYILVGDDKLTLQTLSYPEDSFGVPQKNGAKKKVALESRYRRIAR